ncbi:hypothetical protein, partial [Halomonas sp.]|uniref:hypothetical protein n=1 Tax=Halomonas sp. TaxID=1486246 RepID=UPI003F8F6CD0
LHPPLVTLGVPGSGCVLYGFPDEIASKRSGEHKKRQKTSLLPQTTFRTTRRTTSLESTH